MSLELFNLAFKGFGHKLRPGKTSKSPAEFMQRFPHGVQLIGDGFGIQIFERAYKLNDETDMPHYSASSHRGPC